MRTILEIVSDYRNSYNVIQEEKKKREEIMNSDDYREFQERIEELQQMQLDMLSQVSDSTEEYEADKKELIEYMQRTGTKQIDEFVAKVRKKNEVNTRKVMDELQGDLDNFFLLAKISQKDWKEFCTDNEQYKRAKNKCIDQVGETIVDIELSAGLDSLSQ